MLFYFTLKTLFILKYLISCPDFYDHVGKRIDKKAKVNFKIYDITNILFPERIFNLGIQKSSLYSKKTSSFLLGVRYIIYFFNDYKLACSLNLCPGF